MKEVTQPRVIIKRITEVTYAALEAKINGEGIFGDEPVSPEEKFLDNVCQFGEKVARQAVLAITPTLKLTDTTRILKKLSNADLIKKYLWFFDPAEVVRRNEESQDDVYEAIDVLFEPSANNKAAWEWPIRNAVLIHNYYDDDVCNLFETHQFSAPAINEDISGPKNKKGWEGMRGYGPKTTPFMLQMMDSARLAPLVDMEQIGTVVDFHTTEIAILTKGLTLPRGGARKEPTQQAVRSFYENFCTKTGIPGRLISDAFYRIGYEYCNNHNHQDCPLRDLCTQQERGSRMYYEFGRFSELDQAVGPKRVSISKPPKKELAVA